MKTAFVFPGQGAQYVGMGKDFYEKYPAAKRIFDEADSALGFSISKLCFEGPEEELRLTKNTQPAILTVSIAIYEVMKEQGATFDMAAGHSLGEYSALVAAGAMDFADAVKTVHMRGLYMQEAVPVGEGAMAAVLGMDDANIVAVCQDVEKSGLVVQAVNFNCPGQVVIAGSAEGVNVAVEKLKAAGAKRAVLLPVSAPFHSTLLQPAAEKLAGYLSNIHFKDAKQPVYSNVTAKPVTDKEEIRSLLVKQAASPVLWTNLTQEMVKAGASVFAEIGPGKTLCGFAKKIAKDIPSVNVEDIDSLEKTMNFFKEVG